MTMNPKERLLGAVADLQRFVIHHPDQARCPVCPRWDELQGAAMQAVTAIDAHEAELAALRAELAVLRNNQLGPVPEGPLKALGAWVADHTDDDTWPNAERYLNAALAEMEALRERVARLVGENDAITDLNQTQFLELEHLRRISSAAYRLHDESEEYEFDDGLGRGAPQDLWDALSTAIDTMTDAQRTALGER